MTELSASSLGKTNFPNESRSIESNYNNKNKNVKIKNSYNNNNTDNNDLKLKTSTNTNMNTKSEKQDDDDDDETETMRAIRVSYLLIRSKLIFFHSLTNIVFFCPQSVLSFVFSLSFFLFPFLSANL